MRVPITISRWRKTRLAISQRSASRLEKAESLDNNLFLVHNQLGLLDLNAERLAEAEKEFKSAIDLDPQYAEAQSNLGVLYGQMGRTSEAGLLFRRATENNPKYGQAFAESRDHPGQSIALR